MSSMRCQALYQGGLLILACLLSACSSAAPPMELPPAPTFDYNLLPARSTAPPVTPLPTITPGGQATISFSGEIQPLFNENCVRCHGGIANLWLTDYEQMLLGALNGPVVRPGNPDNSPLYTYVNEGLMPVDTGRLDPEQIELIRRWIEEGALKN